MQLSLSKVVALAVFVAESRMGSTFAAPVSDEVGLDAKFKKIGKLYFGTTLRSERYGAVPEVELEITKEEFGQVTPEHVLTWQAVEKVQGKFDFTDSDKLFDWATSNGKLIRGQTLVWHSQTPAWVHALQTKEVMTEAIVRHVSAVASRYAGKVYSWEVVGEVLEANGALRNTAFYRTFEGPDFITLAFKTAREADPKAKLYIHDYGIDQVNAKLEGLVTLVSKLNTENPGLIDGIGAQGHLVVTELSEPGEGFQEALEALADAEGITEVAVTELCTPLAKPEDYVRAVQACVNVEKCVGVTVWGIADKSSWRSQLYPLLWDDEYKKKPAYDAVIASLSAV